jgi:predicted nucleic acid-binding protein
MTKYVLDSSSLIRYVDNEAGSSRVEEILTECAAGQAEVSISAVQWGEVASNLRKRMGASHERRILSGLLPSEAEIVHASAECAIHAGDLRVDRKIGYADAFALDLAMRSSSHTLVTADYGFKAVDDLARIEFLPAR